MLMVGGFIVCLALAIVGTWRWGRIHSLQRGLRTEYFDNPNWTAPAVLATNEPSIAPATWAALVRQSKLSPTNFSVRWQGWLWLQTAGEYQMHLAADDAGVVNLDGSPAIPAEQGRGADRTIRLGRGFHRVEILFHNASGATNFAFSMGEIHHDELRLVGTHSFFPVLPSPEIRMLVRYPQLLWLFYWGVIVLGLAVARPLLAWGQLTRLVVVTGVALFAVAAIVALPVAAMARVATAVAGHGASIVNLHVLAVLLAMGLSFYGYGTGLLHLLGFSGKTTAIRLAAGAAVMLFSGSILNLLKSISAGVNIVLILSGMVLAVFFLLREAPASVSRRWRRDGGWLAAGLGVLLLAAIDTLANGTAMNFHDDSHGYVNHPKQMLEVGYLQEDPFNTRRSTTLAGQAYLQSLYLSLGGRLESIGYVDALLFKLIFGLSVFFVCLRYSARTRVLGLLLFSFVVFFFPCRQANLTAFYTTMAFFFPILPLLMRPRSFRSRRLVVLSALLIGALLSLKLQNLAVLPPVMLMYCLHLFRARSRITVLVNGGIGGGLALLFTTPWLLDMYRATGSLLVPLLGKGIHAPYHELGLAITAVEPTPLSLQYARSVLDLFFFSTGYLPLVFLLFLPCLYALWRRRLTPAVLALSVVFSALAILWRCDMGYDVLSHRYTSVYVWPVLMFFLFYFTATGILPLQVRYLLLAAAGHLLLIGSWPQIPTIVRRVANVSFRFEFSSPKQAIPPAQQAIPAKAVVLLFHSAPYEFDAARNRVYIADYAGMLGPRPGFRTDNVRAMLKYLRETGIDCIIYSYQDAANYGRTQVGDRLYWSHQPGTFMNIARVTAQHNIDFGDTLNSLIGGDRMVFRNHRDVVFECSSPDSESPRSGPPGVLPFSGDSRQE